MRKKRIGMIGLGLLGGALAERLLGAGFEVAGYDVDAGRREALRGLGGSVAPDAAAIAAAAPRVVLSLPTTQVVESVLAEIRQQLRAGCVIIDTTTGDPERTAALGKDLAASGVEYLDATISGSSDQARRGEAIVMAGGREAAFAAARDVFDAFARRSFHLGSWGTGAKMKLISNLVLGLNRAALAEALAFAPRLGIAAETALAVLRDSPAYSRVMDTKGQKMVEAEFTPQARLAQHLKDVGLILARANDLGMALPLSTAHRELLEAAAAAGAGDLDNSAVILGYGKPAAIEAGHEGTESEPLPG